MFILRRDKYILYLLLYVDDIIVTGDLAPLIIKFLSLLSVEFAMKDLGDLHYFSHVQALCISKGLFLCHDLLLKFYLHTVKPTVCTPLPSRLLSSLKKVISYLILMSIAVWLGL